MSNGRLAGPDLESDSEMSRVKMGRRTTRQKRKPWLTRASSTLGRSSRATGTATGLYGSEFDQIS